MNSASPLVVIDTNVWISGFFWKGVPGKIINLVKQQEIIPVFSFATFDELEETHGRISLTLGRVDEGQIELKYIKQIGAFFAPRSPKVRSRDPHVNMFLDVSVASRARFLITGDRDLLNIKKIEVTKIITPSQFLQIVGVV